jgi:hypothetical protein
MVKSFRAMGWFDLHPFRNDVVARWFSNNLIIDETSCTGFSGMGGARLLACGASVVGKYALLATT